MADEPKVPLNPLSKSATDVLLEAVSQVGGEGTQVIVIIQNKDDRRFLLLCNATHEGAHWLLSKALHTLIDSVFGKRGDD